MGYKQVRICDSCGEDVSQETAYKLTKVIFETEKFTDAAGDRDYNQLQYEFCEYCAKNLLNSLTILIQKTKGENK